MLAPDQPGFGSYRQITLLSGPLILSHTSVMLMNIVDGLFLAHYAEESIAAIGPAGVLFWLFIGLFLGLTGYAGTFVAQYVGAGRPRRVGAAVWQALYVALAAGILIAAIGPLAGPLFDALGHDPAVAQLEAAYFRICCFGSIFFLASSALSGFFAGRHDNVVLMVVHFIAGIINALLDWLLIFGVAGFPEMGISGAAVASVAAHGVSTTLLALMFLHRSHRQQFGTWSDRSLDGPLFRRLCWYGFPNGVRMVVEIAAWAMFLVFVGRVSTSGLAASNIAWRLNGLAFFPLVGLAIALSMLVGQAQGAGRPDVSAAVTWRGLILAELWMLAAALLFVLVPRPLLAPFLSAERLGPEQAALLTEMGVILLRFVAAYCLLDGLNIVLMAVLQGAGDTRWTLLASGVMHGLFLAVLLVLDRLDAGLYRLWAAAMLFVMVLGLVWVWRFAGGAWRPMRVIEHAPPDLRDQALDWVS